MPRFSHKRFYNTVFFLLLIGGDNKKSETDSNRITTNNGGCVRQPTTHNIKIKDCFSRTLREKRFTFFFSLSLLAHIRCNAAVLYYKQCVKKSKSIGQIQEKNRFVLSFSYIHTRTHIRNLCGYY